MAEAFHDVLFPVDISLGSRGGPVRRTEIITLASGQEKRIARWSASRRRYEAGYGVRCRNDIEVIIAFFEAREGRRYGFRFRDPMDNSSHSAGTITPTDQLIGIGDGATTAFQLLKTYQSGPTSHQRTITLPMQESVRIAADGIELEEGNEFTVDHGTGQVSLALAPAPGVQITAGYIFDVPVRFDTDALIIEAQTGGGDIPDIPLVEVRRS
ncbi:MAG: DUF2460 domain-containing protein [Pseudomonadota bacterium]